MCFVKPDNPAAKGVVTHCLDEISKRSNADELLGALASAIAALKAEGYTNLADVFASHLFAHIYTENDKIESFRKYLRDYWFDQSSKKVEFKNLQPIAPVYAEGVLKTISLAREKGLPIDSWWVVDHPSVQMLNLVSDQQVTLIILTPRPEEVPPRGIWSPEAEAWVTAQSDEHEQAETWQIENRPAKPSETQ